MRLGGLSIALLLAASAAASARDVEACATLYRQLANAPQVIGNPAEMRRHMQELARQNIEIRKLRIDMRRDGCGGMGSIVVLGRSDPAACDDMRETLESMEETRQALVDARNKSRQLVRSTEERTLILAAIRSNGCTPGDLQESDKERVKVQGIDLPKEEPAYSSITGLRTVPVDSPKAVEVQSPPPPERPYDPNTKVRMVGPIFLPEENIDLAHPKSPGPQLQQ